MTATRDETQRRDGPHAQNGEDAFAAEDSLTPAEPEPPFQAKECPAPESAADAAAQEVSSAPASFSPPGAWSDTSVSCVAPEASRPEIPPQAQTLPFSSPAPGFSEITGEEPHGEPLEPELAIMPGTDPPGVPKPPDQPEMIVLRSLLLRRELILLEQLKTRLVDPVAHAKSVSEVVAEAILLRAAKDEDKLDRALEPVVEKIVKSSLRGKPLDFANAIFPLMGPAIRRSIAETFRSMLASFHKSIEMAFSWKGLRWRFESLRTGKPFSEVVMLNTLEYRVEQIFLIHRETGIVLNHLANEGVASNDADMVSAMLTAIQDFVRDCFASGRESDLESLEFGGLTILVDQSPYAYLACVIRGTPPLDFREKLRTTLELIHVEFYDALSKFTGDSSPFFLTFRHLENCLSSRMRDREKPLPLWVKAMPAIMALAVVGSLVFWRHSVNAAAEEALMLARETEKRQEEFLRAMNGYTDMLRKEPGMIVIDVREHAAPPWTLVVMKDDLARDPYQVISEAGGQVENFRIEEIPFISLQPDIVTARVKQTIHPPDTVSMEFDPDGTLRLSGTAPMDWIMQARQEALTLPGVKKLDFSKLDDPRMQKLMDMVRRVEAVSIEFPLGKAAPLQADAPKLHDTVATLAELEKLAAEMGISVQVTIFGHADSLGSDQRNYDISQARARMLAAMLYGKGSAIPVNLYGMGAEYADKSATSPLGDPASRKIELRVHLARMTPATPEYLRK